MVIFITVKTSIQNNPIKGVTVNVACISWMEATAYGHAVLHMVDGKSLTTTVSVEQLGAALGRLAEIQLVNVF